MAIVLRFIVLNLDTNEVVSQAAKSLKEARVLANELAAKGGKYQAFGSIGGVFKTVTNVEEIDE